MKKIVLAAAALALSAGAAFAENPHVGEPADLYANDRTPVASQKVDYTALPRSRLLSIRTVRLIALVTHRLPLTRTKSPFGLLVFPVQMDRA